MLPDTTQLQAHEPGWNREIVLHLVEFPPYEESEVVTNRQVRQVLRPSDDLAYG